MAPRKSLQRRSAGAAGRASAGVTISSLKGVWAFRFSGWAMAQVRPWWLTGLGKFTITANGNLQGRQRSAITPIEGQDSELETAGWILNGKITNVAGGEIFDARIRFRQISKSPLTGLQLRGDFFLLAPDPDHLWLISSGATKWYPSRPEVPAWESVQFEAVRSPYK